MVVIPAGRFRMGCLSDDGCYCRSNEKPVREVVIASFALSKHEVTFAQWDACVSGGGCGHHLPNDQGWGRTDRPVVNVSWEDAQSYVSWLSRETGEAYRLPTEAEWEYAARAGTTTKYSWGNEIGVNRANCIAERMRRSVAVHRAGRFVPGQRLGAARHARQCVGVGSGLLERELRGCARGRQRVVERGLFRACFARRILARRSVGPPRRGPELVHHRLPQRRRRFPRGPDAHTLSPRLLTSWGFQGGAAPLVGFSAHSPVEAKRRRQA